MLRFLLKYLKNPAIIGSTKMVLIVRTDLNMNRGKIASQCAHAAVMLYSSAHSSKSDYLTVWMYSGQPKIVLKVETENNLRRIYNVAKTNGLNTALVCDAGRTQVVSGTATVLGIGPNESSEIDKVTIIKLLLHLLKIMKNQENSEQFCVKEEEEAINWNSEALAVIEDIKGHVKSAKISEKLTDREECVFINIITLEQSNYCIELSTNGFRIVGNSPDSNNEDSKQYFETPYSLLDQISAKYRQSFAHDLDTKLKALANFGADPTT